MGCVKWRCQPRGSARTCSHLKAENSDFILGYVCQPQRINYLYTQKQWSRIFWQDFQDLCHRCLISVSSQSAFQPCVLPTGPLAWLPPRGGVDAHIFAAETASQPLFSVWTDGYCLRFIVQFISLIECFCWVRFLE
ncbi:hypothetical protein H8959_003448 [Pygathrix nigripes]